MRERSTGEVDVLGQAWTRDLRPEDVFDREYDRLVKSLTIIAGDKEVAADAVQESFVRLLQRWDEIGTYEDPAGWVRRVALNHISDHHRSRSRQAKLLQRMGQEDRFRSCGLTSDQELWEQLRVLPDRQRTALALHYVGDLTTREVAQVMNVSEGTVARHLHRALRTLDKKVRES